MAQNNKYEVDQATPPGGAPVASWSEAPLLPLSLRPLMVWFSVPANHVQPRLLLSLLSPYVYNKNHPQVDQKFKVIFD